MGFGGGGAGRRGAHLEVGEVASEVGGCGREGQLPGGGRSAGSVLPQSSMKMGFTNHRRSFPMESSISQEQFSSREADLRLDAGGAPGAASLGGTAALPPARWGFSEESQKPVERSEEEVISSGAGPLLRQGCCGQRGHRARGRLSPRLLHGSQSCFPLLDCFKLYHHFLPQEGKPHEVLPHSAGVEPGSGGDRLGFSSVPWHGKGPPWKAPGTQGVGPVGREGTESRVPVDDRLGAHLTFQL